VLLKDVFDYTLEELAELVGSTVGGVKAALNRGRSKLAALPEPMKSRGEPSPELSRLCISTLTDLISVIGMDYVN
jgi:RNA polymerase sigma-70 factor, ECF subfamily